MTAFEVVSVIFGVLGLLGGAVGFFRAVAADRRSSVAEAAAADAQADAASALAKSADATERIAAAVELLARRGAAAGTLLAETLPPELAALLVPREVRWMIEARTVPNSYRLRNVGSLEAREVAINEGSAASVVEPGTATTFIIGQNPRAIEVSWRDDSATRRLSSAVELPPVIGEAENGSA